MAKKHKENKRCRPRTEEVKAKISETEKATQEKKRAAFFATDPKCKECGGPFDRLSILMICRECLIKKYDERYLGRKRIYARTYRQKNRKKRRIYANKYYAENKTKIKLRSYHRQEEALHRGQKI